MFTKMYIKELGDKVIIKAKDKDGDDYGYYAGGVMPYVSSPMKAKLYKSKASAIQTAKRVGIDNYELLNISDLV